MIRGLDHFPYEDILRQSVSQLSGEEKAPGRSSICLPAPKGGGELEMDFLQGQVVTEQGLRALN